MITTKKIFEPEFYYIDGEYFVYKLALIGKVPTPVLAPVTAETLERVYKLSKSQIADLPTFAGKTVKPCNVPEKYSREIDLGDGLANFNLYDLPLHPRGTHTGTFEYGVNWQTIYEFLLHIAPNEKPFPESNYTLFELLLDFLTIVWRKPEQKLPILALVSKERSTGKTTFLNLVKLIFQSNAHFTSVSELESQFNNGWGKATFILTDEAKIPNKLLNMIRSESTAENRTINGKWQRTYPIPTYAKFIMATNDIYDFARIDEDENRYFVIEVKPLPPNTENPNLIKQMEEELPHFLEYLQNHHQLLTKPITRFWFGYEDYRTPALEAVQKRSKPKVYELVEDTLLELHEKTSAFQEEDFEIEFSLSKLREKINLGKGKESELKDILRRFGIHTSEKKKRFVCAFSEDKTNAVCYSITVGELGENLEQGGQKKAPNIVFPRPQIPAQPQLQSTLRPQPQPQPVPQPRPQ